MLSVQAIEEAIQQLPEPDLVELRYWFDQFNEALWDKKIEQDANAGKFNNLASEALAEYYAGKATEL
jgi:hypothetical protein